MAARDWFWIILLGIGWGASFIFNAILLREVGPLTVSFLRISLGALTCWAFVIGTGRKIPWTTLLIGQSILLGIINYAIPFALYPLAQNYIASGVTGIVNAMMPIMVVIVSHFWPGGEKATWLKSLGIVFGFAGIVVLTLPALAGNETSQVWGIFLALLAPVCYAVAMNYLRQLKGLDSYTLSAMALTGGAVAIAPVMLSVEGVPILTRPESWLSIAIMGPILTGVSFIAVYTLVMRVGATNASTVTFVAPISAVFLGALVLGDEVETAHLLGMAMIFCGLLVIDGRLVRWFGVGKISDG